MRNKSGISNLKKEVKRLSKIWTSAETFGIKVIPTKSRERCTHKDVRSKLIDGSGKGKLDYFMPFCNDCGECFPTRGSFRCTTIPLIPVSS